MRLPSALVNEASGSGRACQGERIGDSGACPRALLAWYAGAARALPWRVPPGAGRRPDPYRIWLSEVMLQQTTVAAVRGYYERFLARWPTVAALAAAPDAEVMAAWAGLGYYARARNLLACARVVADGLGGRFPETEAGLAALPGVGPYTAAAIAAIAFDARAVVVDGNVERVMARLFAVEEPLPAAKPRLRALAAALTPEERPGDYAQAVMDLGATICTPRSPACGICPWIEACAGRRAGIAADLPRRAAKAAKPVRRGTAWLALRADGRVLIETRPPSGLLGGMLGLPGDAWAESPPPPRPPLAAAWRDLGEVRHTFTHFHLVLRVRGARLPAGTPAPFGAWRPAGPLVRELPSVMRKALRLGLPALGGAAGG
ncbi:MAG TPA: A/G-specific adenine glycosylase [Amaricoccus sp.]|uniref:A/G-specific adenine glycosylase n=1 Tax=Amaricoccus sp. TaxID=1872485 RepID=UPI002B715233|nr:A/G-specific adenine glycosylase [Amaricoccus sp.]HRO13187.1 A/G-specific adenine glycosylase [Amaricoccus sp.]